MASYLIAMASNPVAMASNLLAMASNLLVMASNLIAIAFNLLANASNLRAMASNLIAYKTQTQTKIKGIAQTMERLSVSRFLLGYLRPSCGVLPSAFRTTPSSSTLMQPFPSYLLMCTSKTYWRETVHASWSNDIKRNIKPH